MRPLRWQAPDRNADASLVPIMNNKVPCATLISIRFDEQKDYERLFRVDRCSFQQRVLHFECPVGARSDRCQHTAIGPQGLAVM